VVEMAFLTWIAIAVVSLVALSALFGLLVARVLGHIGREMSEILEGEAEVWAMAPLARETEEHFGVTSPSTVQLGKETPVRS
jgi:hypothetical protein